MPNVAESLVTFFSPDPAVLVAVRDRVRPPGAAPGEPTAPAPGPRTWIATRLETWFAGGGGEGAGPPALSLEAAVPTGLDVDAWDHDRAFAAWGTSRPELGSELLEQRDDRLVYRLETAWSGPETVWATLSGQHRGLVVHSVASDSSEFASSAWYVGGRAVRAQEGDPVLEDEEVVFPEDWTFSEDVARELLAGQGRGPAG